MKAFFEGAAGTMALVMAGLPLVILYCRFVMEPLLKFCTRKPHRKEP